MSRRSLATAVWLLGLAVCGWVVAQARFTADMAAFLPALPTPLQRLLADQLRDGVAARLILIGIGGAPREELAAASRALAPRLAADPAFAYVANGDASLARADRELLFAYRYVLSPGVRSGSFDAAGLAAALARDYEALGSAAGPLVRRYLPSDPTGEFLRLLGTLEGQGRPATQMGVWMSRDGRYAIALAQTRAPGFDLDAQARNLAAIERAFAAARTESGAARATLAVTGPAVFAVQSRVAIQRDAERLSALAAALVAALLLAVYRSPRLVLLAFVPVGTGVLAGIAAVAGWFGTVHGITLGFGITLIGEAVDYAIYLLSHRSTHETPAASLDRIWPTLRLGMLISAASFCVMLFSGFPGLAQLGLLSVVGLVAALAVTRWLLPHYVARGDAPTGVGVVHRLVPEWRGYTGVRWAVFAAVFAASGAVISARQPIWDDDLGRLNPVSAADQALDQRLRSELGAPDVRLLAVVARPDEEAALQAAEQLGAPLGQLVDEKLISGFDSPAAYLPSRRTQTERLSALPDEARLRADLDEVVARSPFQPGLFTPFVRDVVAARAAPPLDRERLRGTGLGVKVDALLVHRGDAWYALLPLRGVTDPSAVAQRVAALKAQGVELLDLRVESERLLRTYRERALSVWAAGLALIVAVLVVHLRSAARALRVLAPIAAAVAATCACLLAGGAKLTLFHLVALLLVVGVGSNYALFFDRAAASAAERRRTAFSVLLCAATTTLAFGLLALSRTPVLGMIGTTVAIGAVASLVLSALIARPPIGGEREPVC